MKAKKKSGTSFLAQFSKPVKKPMTPKKKVKK